MAEVLEVLVDGGRATPGPPLGPALGPLGVNVPKIISKINEKTKAFEGMKVPVKIIIDKDKNFEITIGTPPVSALILKEIGKELGAKGEKGKLGKEIVGNLTINQVKKIAQMKAETMLGKNLREKAKEIAGTCISMGITIEGKSPKEFINAVKKGEYDKELRE